MNCSAAQMRAQTLGSGRVRDQLLREICRDRGEFYLGEARRYVQRRSSERPGCCQRGPAFFVGPVLFGGSG